MPMDASQLNPFIRYMDLRCGSISYSEPVSYTHLTLPMNSLV